MVNKYEVFLNFFNELIGPIDSDNIPTEVTEVIEFIKSQSLSQKEKPLLTELGLQILEYFQGTSQEKLKASEIAQGMEVSSRKISGAMRKLISDNFIEKFGQNPVIYSLTSKGKDFNLNEYKNNLRNEEE